jgi:hypothetical protein
VLDFFDVIEGSGENSPEEKAASGEPHQEGYDEFYQRDYFEHGPSLIECHSEAQAEEFLLPIGGEYEILRIRSG